ncbi:MAG TPA: CsbD family protein [Acidimicrobiales bacterium]|nr:CsbD family protein [Acidimicrobiales bacterium]
MGAIDKAKDKLEAAEGRVKDAAGAATGDRSMEAEGKAKELSGNLKQAGEKVKDAVGKD